MSITVERRPVKAEEAWQEEEIVSNSLRIILAMYPGERVAFPLAVNGPQGHRVSIHTKGLPQSVASINITPKSSVAPFTSEIEIRANEGASSGLYYFDLWIIDQTKRRTLGTEPLGILILPRNLPRSVVKHYRELRRIYRELGAQGVLWYLIAKVYKAGASFTELKNAYKLIRGQPVRKSTLAVILRRMIRKGLIMKSEDRLYYPLVTRQEVAFSRIDRKRIRIAQPGRNVKSATKERSSTPRRNSFQEPYEAKIAFNIARKIARKHGRLAAAYFLVYSLVGARETGYLLLWFNSMFVYCEQKTGFCHYFYSELLNRYFRLLGLDQGMMYRSTVEYQKALQIANRYIRKHYGSHQAARRIHYRLKKNMYIYRKPDDEILNIEILHYEDGDIGVRVWDNKMEKAKHEENVTNKPLTKKEIKPAYPYEHVYEDNEETYFH